MWWVDVVQAGFLDQEHRGAPADVVDIRYALHHLPDFWKRVALARILEVMPPGWLVRVWDVSYSFDPSRRRPASKRAALPVRFPVKEGGAVPTLLGGDRLTTVT